MRRSVWLLLVVIVLVLSSCGPAMQPATGPDSETGEVFMIALPRIVVDFDAEGSPSMLGLRLADVARYTGTDMSGFQLNPFYVNWMTSANVQHIEMRQTGNGIALFVNGKAMPHLGWSDASLQRASEVAALFNVQNTQMISKLLPIVRRLGLDVVVTFPHPNAEAIALTDPTEAVQVAAQASTEPASAIVQFEVKYDQQGVPGIMGISAADLQAMGLNAPLALAPQYVSQLQASNIQSMELRGRSDGLFIYVNGEPLPNIVWDDAFLGNAADLYAQMNPQSPYIDVAKTVVPLINNADIAVLVHFPVATGQTPLAVKMHLD